MKETSKRLFALLIASVAAAVLSAGARILLTLTSLDAAYGVYAHGAILPTVCHILFFLILAALIACGILLAPKREPDAPIPVNDPTVFLSCLCGFMLAASGLLSLYNMVVGASYFLINVLDVIFAVLSLLYFFGLTKKSPKPTVMTFASIAPTAWFSVTLIRIYFDNSMLHTSPSKTLAELAMLAAMIYFLCESRIHLGILPPKFFLASALAAPVVLITHAVPSLILPGHLLIASSDSILTLIVEAALALFIWARLISFLRAPAAAEAASPEPASDGTGNAEEA